MWFSSALPKRGTTAPRPPRTRLAPVRLGHECRRWTPLAPARRHLADFERPGPGVGPDTLVALRGQAFHVAHLSFDSRSANSHDARIICPL